MNQYEALLFVAGIRREDDIERRQPARTVSQAHGWSESIQRGHERVAGVLRAQLSWPRPKPARVSRP